MIAIIPARGQSKRIPRKNIKDFRGKPIIQYSIEVAEKSGLFDDIYVSTEDAEIALVASNLGASIHMRPVELADDITGTQEVAADLLKALDRNPEEMVCVLYATVPLLTVENLRWGLRLLNISRNHHYAHTVDSKGRDIGNYYFGRAKEFTNETPLHDNSLLVPISDCMAIDINTIDDWKKAEEMYDALL